MGEIISANNCSILLITPLQTHSYSFFPSTSPFSNRHTTCALYRITRDQPASITIRSDGRDSSADRQIHLKTPRGVKRLYHLRKTSVNVQTGLKTAQEVLQPEEHNQRSSSGIRLFPTNLLDSKPFIPSKLSHQAQEYDWAKIQVTRVYCKGGTTFQCTVAVISSRAGSSGSSNPPSFTDSRFNFFFVIQ